MSPRKEEGDAVKMFGPFVELARLQNEINKIFESFLEVSPEESVKAASGWMPRSNRIGIRCWRVTPCTRAPNEKPMARSQNTGEPKNDTGFCWCSTG